MFTYKIGKGIYNILLDIQDEESINEIEREILMIMGIFTFCLITTVTFIMDLVLAPLELITIIILKKIRRNKHERVSI